MIGPPELEGEWSGAEPAEPLAEPEAGAGSGRRPWRWAVGGALAASAVWAGVLLAQDRFTASGPPLAYRYVEDLCVRAPLKAVGTIGGGFGTGTFEHGQNPALKWSSCEHFVSHDARRTFAYGARVLVELHGRTDPEPEFGERPEPYGMFSEEGLPVDPQLVPGLGERAVFTGFAQAPRITVLDGGAVFTLDVQWFRGIEEERPEIDEDAVRSAMIEDVRALMARLRE
ncbi:hypothetical protein ACIRP0_02065 [Streptomyces sp. NPDC101733]|uniref:hypothetical protein n=1 Tax=unclassified Streptomyces TaxID=2593676 RepID=UPI00382F8AC7